MKIEEKKGKLTIVDFNELEAYKIACKIEADGIRFYQNILKGIKNKYIKEKIEYLLGEEREHLRFFESRLSEIGQNIEDAFEEDDLLKYMDYGIFQSPEVMKGVVGDVKKSLEIAINIEKRSIEFYHACRDNVLSSKTKQELQNIIKEEKKHKDLFLNMIDKF